MSDERIGVLFVCLGNICRSPLAEALFRKAVSDAGLDGRFRIDSAGTSGYHDGEPPDARTTETARRRGVAVTGTSRRITAGDLEAFHYVVVMDAENLAEVRNSGFELGLRGEVLRTANVGWDFGFTATFVDNELVDLGEDAQGNPIPPISMAVGRQRHVEGYELGAYWNPPIQSYEDANGDGLLQPDVVQAERAEHLQQREGDDHQDAHRGHASDWIGRRYGASNRSLLRRQQSHRHRAQ